MPKPASPVPNTPPVDLPELDLDDMLQVADEPPNELDKILELLLDPRNIAHNTELSRNEITAFSVLSTMRTRHNLPVLREFLADNLVYRVSKGRAGRKEWVRILNRQMQNTEMDEQPRSRFGGIFRQRR